MKREGLVHNVHGVKTEQVTAEGLGEFTHEVCTLELLRNDGMPRGESKRIELRRLNFS